VLTELGRIGEPEALDEVVKWVLEHRPFERSLVLHGPL